MDNIKKSQPQRIEEVSVGEEILVDDETAEVRGTTKVKVTTVQVKVVEVEELRAEVPEHKDRIEQLEQLLREIED